MIRCKKCDGINIEQKAWIDPNDHEILDACSDGDIEDNFCRDCDDHVEFIYEYLLNS